MAWERWLPACIAVAAVSACGSEAVSTTGDQVLPTGESLEELRRQAGRALARYDEAVAEAGGSEKVTVTLPSWDPTVGAPGLAIESARVTPGGTRLTVSFTGARGPAVEPCGTDYAAEAVESARAVVVILVAQHHADNEICTFIGFPRTATVNLVQPLAGRAVLEVREGQPVPVSTGAVAD